MSSGEQWIDYDLTIVPEDQGAGLIEQPPAELLSSFADIPWYEEIAAGDMIPAAKRKELAAERWPLQRATIGPIQSQGRTGACVGFSTAKGVTMTLARRYGQEFYVELSGMSVYDQIGSSVSSGAYIPDGIAYASETGPLPLRGATGADKYEITFPGLTWKWKRPEGWREVAGQFVITQAAKASGVDMIQSAMINNLCGIVGRSRHAIPYCGCRPSDLAIPYANSWSPEWGDEGIGYDSVSTYRGLIVYLILEVKFRPDIPLPIPAG
jgi:hypothetical protein